MLHQIFGLICILLHLEYFTEPIFSITICHVTLWAAPRFKSNEAGIIGNMHFQDALVLSRCFFTLYFAAPVWLVQFIFKPEVQPRVNSYQHIFSQIEKLKKIFQKFLLLKM